MTGNDQRRYRIRHRTAYDYSGRIDLCHSLAHLAPREELGQSIESHRISVSPQPEFRAEHCDYLGNRTHYFCIQSSHESLDVISDLVVRKASIQRLPAGSNTAWDELEIQASERDPDGILFGHFLLPTPACPLLASAREYLEPSLQPGADVLEVVGDLMRRVYDDFIYKPGSTGTKTPLAEVLAKRKGVCQDFAHVMIAALRSRGIPTRYVSGYLETLPPPGREKLRGSDASHAWIEAWAPGRGWVGFDPTNNKRPGEQHIKICHGRDYFDVQPVRGIFLGSGGQQLSVEVDVEQLS